MRCYAIGDVHGQFEALQIALDVIERDRARGVGGADAPVVFVGDYTDRGADSRATLAFLIEAQAEGRNWVMLKGNHDRMFRRFVADGTVHDAAITSGLTWLNPRLGGQTTLASYLDLPGFLEEIGGTEARLSSFGDDPRHGADLDRLLALTQASVPRAHLAFIDALPLTFAYGDLLFVHAGLRPGRSLEMQVEDDLIWIRGPWLESNLDHGPLVVHGHTALEMPTHHGNRVNIDGGAGYGRPLVPVVFEGRACWTLTEEGRVPLTP